MLTATKVACPGESATVTVSVPLNSRRSNLHVYEINGGWGGDVAVDLQTEGAFGATHTFPDITPTAAVEAFILAAIDAQNAYGINSGPSGGYAAQPASVSNDGASDRLSVFTQHTASASGTYSGGNIVYSAGTTTRGTQMWFKAALDDAACLDIPAVDWDVYEIVAPGDTMTLVGTLDDAYDRSIRAVRNQPGSGQFTINRNSANATAAILKQGNLVKCRYPEIHTDHIFSFFMGHGNFELVSSEEEGGEEIKIGGDGSLSYWDRAVWLSSKFTIPWWPATMATPPAGTRGAVQFAAGTYRRYTIAGGVITGYANFTTAGGFSAYFDSRQTYLWPSANSKRFLVHLTTTEDPAAPDFTGYYVHPKQDGVTEILPSYAVGTSTSVLLSDISPDKPGAILYRMFEEATDPSRPTQPIPLMTIDFTATLDSNGDPWATTDALAGLTAQLNETYLSTIAKLLSTGVIDVEMGPDLDMHAYNALGRDLTSTTFAAGKVRFAKGVNLADKLSREREDGPVATFMEVVGLDGVVGQASLPDAATRVAREAAMTADSNVEATLEAIGLAALNSRLIRSDAVGFKIATGDDDATGRYLPGPAGTDNGDFWTSDLVTLHTGTGEQDFDNATERVYAVTLAEDEGGNLEVTPEVGSVLGEAERRLYASAEPARPSFAARSQYSETEVAESSGDADDHIADTTAAHVASAIGFTPAGGIAATDVQGAIVEDAADLAAHAAAADPHTAYQRESEKGVALGYASLGADGLVPQDQLGTGTQDGTKFLRDDGTWQAGGATGSDAGIWRPLLNGSTGDIITDATTGEAIMGFGPP